VAAREGEVGRSCVTDIFFVIHAPSVAKGVGHWRSKAKNS
jgi:hypothetical protein